MRSLLPFLLALFSLNATAQQWNWATSGGGTSNEDQCYAIATDSQGNVYYAGTTRGSNGVFACGAVDVGATTGAVVVKYSAQGTCLWLRTITVPSFDARAYAIAIDAQDRIYVTGSYRGTATFSDSLSLASFGSNSDIFLARYDTAGYCLWARRAGGNYWPDEARGIALSDDGGIFIAGKSGGDPIRVHDQQLANPGEHNQVFLARFDSTGAVQWARISTGNGDTKSCRGISISGDKLYVTGQANFATASYGNLSLNNNASTGNLYVLACDLDGNGLWSRAYSGLSNVEGMGIAADSLGNLFVVGRLWGSLHLPDDTLASVSSDDDILLLGLDQEGNYRWGHSAGSAARDLAWGVTTDGMGNAYVAMHFQQTIHLLGQSITALGSEDALILKLRAEGTPVWYSRPSGYQRDIALCIHRQLQAPHRLYFGGYFWGTITYGNSTISDVLNGDGMLVSGMDTTFAVNVHSIPACPGACNGSRTVFINGDGPFNVLWSDGATATTLLDQCAGELSVVVSDAHGQSIIVDAALATSTDPALSVLQLNDSLWVEGGTGWQWFLNGAVLAGADSAWHLALSSGMYHVAYVDAQGCAWLSDTLSVVLGTGVEDVTVAAPVLYPNPGSDRIWLRNGLLIASARAWSMAGQRFDPVVEGNRMLHIAQWTPGLWMVELTFTDGSTGRYRVLKVD
ncbi:MAG: SBBP repeat-containing protein [Flavobacteriales bacterium]